MKAGLAACLATGLGVFLALFLGRGAKPPALLGVGPYPGSTIGVARPVTAAFFASPAPRWQAGLVLDGLPRGLWPLRRRQVVFSLPALTPGRHRLDLVELGPGAPRAFRWFVSVVPRPLPALPREGAAGRREREAVNEVRARAGVPPLAYDGALAAASSAHARYFLANAGRTSAITVAVHRETPGRPGFVGTGPLARDTYFGFGGEGVSEVMAFGVSPLGALELWLSSVYHRLGLLDPSLAAMGFGQAGRAGKNAFLPVTVLDAGYWVPARLALGQATVYPRPGQMGVPLAFPAGEVPDPADSLPGARYPLGYPITVAFFSPAAKTLSDVRAALFENGRPVAAYVLAPANDVHKDELGASVALLKKTPLAKGADYRALVLGSVVDADGRRQPFRVALSFTTRPAPRPSDLGPQRTLTVAGQQLPVRPGLGTTYVRAVTLARLGVAVRRQGLLSLSLTRGNVRLVATQENLYYQQNHVLRRWHHPPAGHARDLWLSLPEVLSALDLGKA